MAEFLQQIDLWFFRLCNGTLANPVLDVTMPFLTDLLTHRIVLAGVAALLLWMILRGGRAARLAALLLVPTILIGDQLSSAVIKPLVGRLRPCHVLSDVRLLVHCGGALLENVN